ncbi:MAG: hypothetical protein NTX25_03090 [Proteobacteria bacterium]|nr:hypothetical protein [Pseudomonadota bacterium]
MDSNRVKILVIAFFAILSIESIVIAEETKEILHDRIGSMSFLTGDAVGPKNGKGYAVGFYFPKFIPNFESNLELLYQKAEQIVPKSYDWASDPAHPNIPRPYLFHTERYQATFNFRRCFGNPSWVQFCPMAVESGFVIRNIGGKVRNEYSHGLDPYVGDTIVSTLGFVLGFGPRIYFSRVYIDLKFMEFILPVRALYTRDTFPSEATDRDRRISKEALQSIHYKPSSLFQIVQVGVSL